LGGISQFSGASDSADLSICEIDNFDEGRACGQHRPVEFRPDIAQLCYIPRAYFMYYLTIPVYLPRD
jgi:hypothetical protein